MSTTHTPKIWESIEECDGEFYCNIHDQMAFDCNCPMIDDWVEAGRNPYDDEVTWEVRAWVEANPYQDE